ncbi:MAG: YraN family protein [Eubacteriales bacterium]|nr:YraN family protein [Eubacteriales bacterium]
MRVNRRQTGTFYEQIAAEYLQEKGLVILERNFRCRMGEIDLITKDGRYFVFVEVKYRKGSGSGYSFSGVHPKKQKKIIDVAKWYLLTKRCSLDTPCRFDVVGIDGDQIQWLKNAFET